MDWIKIGSVVVSAAAVIFRMGQYEVKIEEKMQMVADHETRIKALETWQQRTATYYFKPLSGK